MPRIALALAVVALAAPAAAEGIRVVEPYGPTYAYGGDYGYAGEFVRGSYVGAPLTRFPRPNDIVPAPWSYGTYGVPTVSGIPPSPVAQPSITVVDGGGRGLGRTREGRAPGAQVIEVRVPRR